VHQNDLEFPSVRFPTSFFRDLADRLIAEARPIFRGYLDNGNTMYAPDVASLEPFLAKLFDQVHNTGLLTVTVANSTWHFEKFEEMLVELQYDYDDMHLVLDGWSCPVAIRVSEKRGQVSVSISGTERNDVERYAQIFQTAAPRHRLPDPPAEAPQIFIGHGGNAQWQTLKTYLHDQMGYSVEAYETLPRAGFDIKDVLEDALERNNFALIVMTAEDEQPDRTIRARQNVVHEAGLFQGRLGFKRAIILLEDGAEEFSNIAGVQQLRFPHNRISAIHGDVVATLKREFNL
jgi:predicted nucleotide-binding protein